MVQRHWRRPPETLRFLLPQYADGMALGGVAGPVMIYLDVGGIGTEFATEEGAGPAVLFFALNLLGWGVAVAGGAARFRCER